MTRTGYSCQNMRRKNKHGCQEAVEHWCAETGKLIDPMSCHAKCKLFATLAERHRPAKKKIADELL